MSIWCTYCHLWWFLSSASQRRGWTEMARECIPVLLQVWCLSSLPGGCYKRLVGSRSDVVLSSRILREGCLRLYQSQWRQCRSYCSIPCFVPKCAITLKCGRCQTCLFWIRLVLKHTPPESTTWRGILSVRDIPGSVKIDGYQYWVLFYKTRNEVCQFHDLRTAY